MANKALTQESDRGGSQAPGEIEILWINGGLGCDGESIAMTAATQPKPQGIVALKTGFGGTRIVDMLVGEQLPRIC